MNVEPRHAGCGKRCCVLLLQFLLVQATAFTFPSVNQFLIRTQRLPSFGTARFAGLHTCDVARHHPRSNEAKHCWRQTTNRHGAVPRSQFKLQLRAATRPDADFGEVEPGVGIGPYLLEKKLQQLKQNVTADDDDAKGGLQIVLKTCQKFVKRNPDLVRKVLLDAVDCFVDYPGAEPKQFVGVLEMQANLVSKSQVRGEEIKHDAFEALFIMLDAGVIPCQKCFNAFLALFATIAATESDSRSLDCDLDSLQVDHKSSAEESPGALADDALSALTDEHFSDDPLVLFGERVRAEKLAWRQAVQVVSWMELCGTKPEETTLRTLLPLASALRLPGEADRCGEELLARTKEVLEVVRRYERLPSAGLLLSGLRLASEAAREGCGEAEGLQEELAARYRAQVLRVEGERRSQGGQAEKGRRRRGGRGQGTGWGKGVDAEVAGLLDEISPTVAKMRKQEAMLDRLERMVGKELGKGTAIRVYGSTATGLMTRHSDMDLVLLLPKGFVNKPSKKGGRDDRRPFGDEEGRKRSQAVLRRLWRLMKFRHKMEVDAILYATVPILKIDGGGGGLEADLSVAAPNQDPFRGTNFMLALLRLDPRVRALVLLVKGWVRQRGIGDASTGSFNAYGFSLLTLFYLQSVTPPVLPRFVRRQEGSDELWYRAEGGEWSSLAARGKGRRWRSDNADSVKVLLEGFFTFYALETDLGRQEVSLVEGEGAEVLGERREGVVATVVDPVEMGDVGRSVQRRGLARIREEMERGMLLAQAGNLEMAVLVTPQVERVAGMGPRGGAGARTGVAQEGRGGGGGEMNRRERRAQAQREAEERKASRTARRRRREKLNARVRDWKPR